MLSGLTVIVTCLLFVVNLDLLRTDDGQVGQVTPPDSVSVRVLSETGSEVVPGC